MSPSYLVETVHSSENQTTLSTALVLRDSTTFGSQETSAFHPTSLPLVPFTPQAITPYRPSPPPTSYQASTAQRTSTPHLIATISAGFEKGDYLIREEKGSNIYFDFFEEAFNFISQKGYTRMPKCEEGEYIEVIRRAHKSVPGGGRFNTGRLLMVLHKKLVPLRIDSSFGGDIVEGGSLRSSILSGPTKGKKKNKKKSIGNKLKDDHTLSTKSESSPSKSYSRSSASTSFVDSWE